MVSAVGGHVYDVKEAIIGRIWREMHIARIRPYADGIVKYMTQSVRVLNTRDKQG